MKPPFSYYGGKQLMVPKILPLIPRHTLYCEPFTGGASIFFAKKSSEVEILNDTNKELINFYKMVKYRFYELEKKVNVTLHSRSQYSDASVIYNHPHLHNEIDRAWAVWTLGVMGFGGILDGSWSYEKKGNKLTTTTSSKRRLFTDAFAVRLQNVQIECADALYIIESRDTDNSFYYIDPLYYNANMGHYGGYTIDDFEKLLIKLGSIKGKFLLSSYPSELLKNHIKENGWYRRDYEMRVCVTSSTDSKKKKIEVLTANYPIDNEFEIPFLSTFQFK